MKRVELIQLGLGNVGRAVAQIILEERKRWLERWGVEIVYKAVADTSGALVGEDLLPQAVRLKEEGGKLSSLGVEPLEEVLHSEPEAGTTRVVVDLAVHGDTSDLDLLGVRRGRDWCSRTRARSRGQPPATSGSSGLWGTVCGTRRPSERGCP